MASPARLVKGFTLTELLVTLAVIAVIGILVSLAIPAVTCGPVKGSGRLIQAMSNERQICTAAMAMATDGRDYKDPALGWPGDLKAGGWITTLADYVNLLVQYDYLKADDLKVFSCFEIKPYRAAWHSGSNGVLSPAFTEENSAFKVFLVKDADSPETVFLTTKNYTYNKDLTDPKAKPFGDRGFVVIRKGGDASILKKQQTQKLQMIGSLPGGSTIESAENCLNPGSPVSR